MLTIRRAEPLECEILTKIAVNSEAFWGYDQAFMDKFSSLYRITEDAICYYPTFALEIDGDVCGFYSFVFDKEEIVLEHFFIEPNSIGMGYGRILWNHLLGQCRALGIRQFSLVTSPQAQGFYAKRGAVFAGEVESIVEKGRMITRMIYKMED